MKFCGEGGLEDSESGREGRERCGGEMKRAYRLKCKCWTFCSKLLDGTHLLLYPEEERDLDHNPHPRDTPRIVAARHHLPVDALIAINAQRFKGLKLKPDTPLKGKPMLLRDRESEADVCQVDASVLRSNWWSEGSASRAIGCEPMFARGGRAERGGRGGKSGKSKTGGVLRKKRSREEDPPAQADGGGSSGRFGRVGEEGGIQPRLKRAKGQSEEAVASTELALERALAIAEEERVAAKEAAKEAAALVSRTLGGKNSHKSKATQAAIAARKEERIQAAMVDEAASARKAVRAELAAEQLAEKVSQARAALGLPPSERALSFASRRWNQGARVHGMRRLDDDGSLTSKLAKQEHTGDPTKEGVIWSRIAEVSSAHWLSTLGSPSKHLSCTLCTRASSEHSSHTEHSSPNPSPQLVVSFHPPLTPLAMSPPSHPLLLPHTGRAWQVGLLVTLGGGCALLCHALRMLKQEGWYHFVVCQATVAAVGFYERFGFCRVGAVARYAPQGIPAEKLRQVACATNAAAPTSYATCNQPTPAILQSVASFHQTSAHQEHPLHCCTCISSSEPNATLSLFLPCAIPLLCPNVRRCRSPATATGRRQMSLWQQSLGTFPT